MKDSEKPTFSLDATKDEETNQQQCSLPCRQHHLFTVSSTCTPLLEWRRLQEANEFTVDVTRLRNHHLRKVSESRVSAHYCIRFLWRGHLNNSNCDMVKSTYSQFHLQIEQEFLPNSQFLENTQKLCSICIARREFWQLLQHFFYFARGERKNILCPFF